jgi:CubicO group peptidase (beta-lactamase class C family)
LSAGIEFYRGEIERRRDLLRRGLLWSFAPILLVIGTFISALGKIGGDRGIFPKALPFLILVFVWIAAYFVIRVREQRELHREIEQLDRNFNEGESAMIRRNVFYLFGATIWMALGDAQTPADSEILGILKQRVDEFHQSVGIVVGTIGPEGRKVVTYGSLEKGDSRVLNGDTVFEIGSVTKVFTSLLLSDMVQRGQVALTDPVSKYLPATVKMPQRDGKQITLQDLATHTSGLPRLPGNLKPKDFANPYADYTVAQMYEFLSSYELPRDIGSKYEYSNLGGGLLGHVLALRAGMDYEALLRARITGPLDMKNTGIALTPEMKAHLAPGHDGKMKTVANWDLPTLAGAGALRSTANDLLTFVAANLGYQKTPLAPAMAAMLDVRKPTGIPGVEVALAWHVSTTQGSSLIWHNGGTGGYRTFIGFDPKTKIGVVALSNASTGAGVDDIGMHLLNAKVPLLTASAFLPAKERKQVAVDPKVFAKYAGKYQLAPNFILTVTREGDRLFAQATGQPKFELFAEGEKEYFLKAVDAQITFVADADEAASQLVLHQAGKDMPAKRVE